MRVQRSRCVPGDCSSSSRVGARSSVGEEIEPAAELVCGLREPGLGGRTSAATVDFACRASSPPTRSQLSGSPRSSAATAADRLAGCGSGGRPGRRRARCDRGRSRDVVVVDQRRKSRRSSRSSTRRAAARALRDFPALGDRRSPPSPREPCHASTGRTRLAAAAATSSSATASRDRIPVRNRRSDRRSRARRADPPAGRDRNLLAFVVAGDADLLGELPVFFLGLAARRGAAASAAGRRPEVPGRLGRSPEPCPARPARRPIGPPRTGWPRDSAGRRRACSASIERGPPRPGSGHRRAGSSSNTPGRSRSRWALRSPLGQPAAGRTASDQPARDVAQNTSPFGFFGPGRCRA